MAYKKLKVGNICNNKCIFCNSQNIKSPNNKTTAEISNELKVLAQEGIKEIILPCNTEIRKDFLQILKSIKSYNFYLILESNGRLFYYKKYCQKISRFVNEIHIIKLGTNAEQHDQRTRVPGSFQQLERGLLNLNTLSIPYHVKKLHLSEYSAGGILDKPNQVVIEITARCNFDCIACFNKISFANENRSHNEMSTHYIKDIIENIADFGVKRVRFSGGEPLLRKDIFELMDHARKKGLWIWLNTNATLVTEKNLPLLEKYVENILVPFNGYDEDSDYKWTQTENSFSRKMIGVQLLKKSGIKKIRGGTVGTIENIQNLESIYRIIRDLELDEWEIYRPVPLNPQDHYFSHKQLMNKLVSLSLDYGQIIPIANAYPFCLGDKRFSDIFSLGAASDDGHARVVVDPRAFCKPSYFIEKNIGDPLNIEDCWKNPLMKNIRYLQLVPDECGKCSFLYKCKGGSRYAAKITYGAFKCPDPLSLTSYAY